MRISKTLLMLGSALAVSVGASGLQAAGGGGGGGFSGSPSQSAPRYDATAEYQKGVAYLQAEDYKNAAKAFKRSTSVARTNGNAQYLLGYSYIRLDEHKKAVKPLERAVKYSPELIDAHRDLAIAYHKTGKAEKATAAFGKLKDRKAACGESCAEKAELDAAVAMVEAAMNGEEQASLDLNPAFNTAGKASDAVYLSAVSLINEGQYEAALSELQQAGREFGPHPDVLTYIGFANRKLKKFDVAEDYYQRALAVAPNHLGAIEYYGELKVERGDLDGAKEHLARLETLCTFGCYEAEELRRWITEAQRS